MAKRFGGRFSPQQTRLDGSDPRPPARPHPGEMRHPLESRTRWVTIMAIPFLISAFWQDPNGLALHLIAFGSLAHFERVADRAFRRIRENDRSAVCADQCENRQARRDLRRLRWLRQHPGRLACLLPRRQPGSLRL